jgi:predicted aldo/keto reductase-like oxidoreductase
MEPLLGGKLATGLPSKAAKLFAETGDTGSAASWAFRWLWNQPEVTVVLSGMNGADQLDDNLKTAETAKPCMLKDKEAAIYTPVIAAIREAYRVNCTGCNYCMPCPKGVDIPNCFSAYNTSYAISFISGLILYVTSTGLNRPEKDHSARHCAKCGACEKKCPQHIQISKELTNVNKRLEPLWFAAIMGLVRKVTK